MFGGMRAFLRRGKFTPTHSELEDFLSARITRGQGMAHIRNALLPYTRSSMKLRGETLNDLRAWDLVYLDHLAAGRLVPGEPTAAAEPLHGLSANEALLIRHAKSKRLLRNLPPIVQRSLQSRIRKMAAIWAHDAKEYDRMFGSPKSQVQGPKSKRRRRRSAAGKPKPKRRPPGKKTKPKKAKPKSGKRKR